MDTDEPILPDLIGTTELLTEDMIRNVSRIHNVLTFPYSLSISIADIARQTFARPRRRVCVDVDLQHLDAWFQSQFSVPRDEEL